ncbi:MAG: hypothetical protein ACE5O2_00645, partial [Armatimonadota bacterium]
MKAFLLVIALSIAAGACAADATAPLKHSDVLFMYVASPETYKAYNGTVVEWGGHPPNEAGVQWFVKNRVKPAHDIGMEYVAGVGMVTEFARFIDREPEWEKCICLTVEGERIKVPWLWDHSHKGIPAYWFCTNSPQFRKFLRDMVVLAMKSGADGLHVDDHLGTAATAWRGGCYCDYCIAAFREYLRENVAREDLARAGVRDLQDFDYREFLLKWMREHPESKRSKPLGHEFAVFQARAAAGVMRDLRRLAEETAGRPIKMSANAGMPNARHLIDYESLDYFCCEVNHEASKRRPSDHPLVGYRLAEGFGRAVVATASGWDWAFIKEHDLPGLVRQWIAEAYALGHYFMVPHHQWCYTKEKGTHWYDGRTEEFADLYQFVRSNAALFDDHETVTRVGVLYGNAAYWRGDRSFDAICQALARANIPFGVAAAGDEFVPRTLTTEDLARFDTLIVSPAIHLEGPSAEALKDWSETGRVITWRDEADLLRRLSSPVAVQGARNVWVLPRAPRGARSAFVCHLINRNYDPDADGQSPLRNFTVEV